MVKANPRPKEAQEILDRDHRYLGELGPRGWLDELKRLCVLSIDNDLGLHSDDGRIEVHKVGGRTRVLVQSVPVVQLVERHNHDVRIPKHRLPALVVNLSASDPEIRAEFERVFAEARRCFPLPIQKPGPGRPEDFIGERTFRSWRSAEIVRLAELLVWRAKLSKLNAQAAKPYKQHVLGEWVGFRSKEATNRAKATLRKAFASLPTLVAQIKYEKDPDRMAANLLEAEMFSNLPAEELDANVPADEEKKKPLTVAELAAQWEKEM